MGKLGAAVEQSNDGECNCNESIIFYIIGALPRCENISLHTRVTDAHGDRQQIQSKGTASDFSDHCHTHPLHYIFPCYKRSIKYRLLAAMFQLFLSVEI